MPPKSADAPSSGPATPSNKRKLPPRPQNTPDPKRYKPMNRREIAVQTTDSAFSNGELRVADFVKAREFEIKALENSMREAKKALSTRAFQDVPRGMRRRTASHDVKRVPNRLRNRATKEMAEDNTPRRVKTVSGKARLRKQIVQQILNKERHDVGKKRETEGKAKKEEERARQRDSDAMQIDDVDEEQTQSQTKKSQKRRSRVHTAIIKSPPLPKAKFRKRQISKAWLPTHVYHAKRAHMTPPSAPLWRFALALTPTEKSYRTTHRSGRLRGAIAWDTSYMATIGLEGPERSIEGLLKALGVGADGRAPWSENGRKWQSGSRSWNGWCYERQTFPEKSIAPVTIIWNPEHHDDAMDVDDPGVSKKEDKRKVIIRVHPAGFMQLWEQVTRLGKVQKPHVAIQDLRFEIGSVDIAGPASIETLAGTIHPVHDEHSSGNTFKRLAGLSTPSLLPNNIILGFSVTDPRLRHPPTAISTDSTVEAQPELMRTVVEWPLDGAIARHAIFDHHARTAASSALPSSKSINRRQSAAQPATYPEPLSTDPRIPVLVYAADKTAGHQGALTLLAPWKTIDPIFRGIMHYPLNTGGNPRFGGIHEKMQLAFEAGKPWFPADYPATKAGWEWEQKERAANKLAWEKKPPGRRPQWDRLDLGLGRRGEVGIGWGCDWAQLVTGVTSDSFEDLGLVQLPYSVCQAVIKGTNGAPIPERGIGPVKISMIAGGVPQTRARVYRLPTENAQLQQAWRQLLRPSLRIKLDDPTYPVVPDECDLIGFVTSGNFNLAEGKGTAIGSLQLSKISNFEDCVCLVRNAGESHGQLAEWQLA